MSDTEPETESETKKTRRITTNAWKININNYTEEHVKRLQEGNVELRGAVAGHEVAPTTGTIHLEGMICAHESISMNQVKSILGKNISCWPMQGTWDQCKSYCMKGDGIRGEDGKCLKDDRGYFFPGQNVKILVNWGSGPMKGARTDLASLKRGAEAMETDYELYQRAFTSMLRYGKGIKDYRDACLEHNASKAQFKGKTIRIFWGLAGSNKTRKIKWNEDSKIQKSDYFEPLKDQHGKYYWYSGYRGQKIILLEEFDGSQIDYQTFLKMTDGNPSKQASKGGQTWIYPDEFVITSNISPWEWWKKDDICCMRDNAFLRRVIQEYEFK